MEVDFEEMLGTEGGYGLEEAEEEDELVRTGLWLVTVSVTVERIICSCKRFISSWLARSASRVIEMACRAYRGPEIMGDTGGGKVGGGREGEVD